MYLLFYLRYLSQQTTILSTYFVCKISHANKIKIYQNIATTKRKKKRKKQNVINTKSFFEFL